ncbi:glycerate kinase [Alteribacillus persepolensis]|uniref:Glycerate kinase n=1 Tax=Alteribacillus persepolensis TaxID=568899 RepID=A0A1G8FKE0_9BACI|nr:glycerate kinase [Alteribacillus persepolensis]SDH82577.1 glycerate kinase [Alteribacillus persepolensis]
MKIVIAPDSFKESMTAMETASCIKEGLYKCLGNNITLEIIPMADGGEGTTRSMADALGGTIHKTVVTGPLGDKVEASYAFISDTRTAVLEMAEASGIGLVAPSVRNPLKATTYGTGELIKAALNEGAKKIILGIGGSATNDGGAGMIQALGGKLLDDKKQEIPRGGEALLQLHSIDLSGVDERLFQTEIVAACDVNNPLTGENGASVVYGPQKGASKEMVHVLDDALHHYASVIRHKLGAEVETLAGAGAAGGLGAGLVAFLQASLKPGIDIVLQETNFYKRVKGADLVITGEGRIDKQTIYGKTPVGVAKAAKSCSDVPVIALCGQLGPGYEAVYHEGITAVFSIAPGPISTEEAMANGKEYVTGAARNIAALMFHSKH